MINLATELKNVSFDSLKEEYKKLKTTNTELLEGLYYAASIQQGLLPQERHFNRYFNEYFVFYKPQQIIGGDLYWIGMKNDEVYFAAADCTGHGVSGAMLSVLAISYLNYLLLGKDFNCLGEFLNELDKKWIETFSFSTDYTFDNDWMEISIASFNKLTRELRFAGANNNIVLISEIELKVIDGDSFPIGGWQIEKNRQFKEHKLILPENTMVYIGSDGFKDQLGGMNNKRFKKRNLFNLLHQISSMSCNEQHKYLEIALKDWKKVNFQTDDVCILGVRL